jgi:Cu/Ag efflux pump CusA
VAQLQKKLPAGVVIDTIYDRSDFVSRTVVTVLKNLLEGSLVVLVVLAFFLGSVRGDLAVVLGIPVSMSIALIGIHVFHVTGVFSPSKIAPMSSFSGSRAKPKARPWWCPQPWSSFW